MTPSTCGACVSCDTVTDGAFTLSAQALPLVDGTAKNTAVTTRWTKRLVVPLIYATETKRAYAPFGSSK